MLGDVGRSSAVFATERKTLEQAKRDEKDRRSPADTPDFAENWESGLAVGRQEANGEGRQTHDKDCHEKRVLAPDEISDPAKDHRAKRANQESRCVGRECRQERGGIVAGGKEKSRNRRGSQHSGHRLPCAAATAALSRTRPQFLR